MNPIVRWVLGGVGVIVVAGGVAALTGRKSVHAELVIPAKPEAVWAMITDAKGYEAWNPILVRAEGEYARGATIRYAMRDPKGATADVSATVKEVVPGALLAQSGGWPGLMTFAHEWRLEEVDGGTKVTQHEEYRGLGVWFWDPSWVQDAYAAGNRVLGERLKGK